MSSPPITTIVKMVESLPDDLQEKVAEHIREYTADFENEYRRDSVEYMHLSLRERAI
jgi:hypothetical protein